MWNSAGELEEVELTEKYVKFLLSPSALKKELFRSDTFVCLRKYDRQQTVDEGPFEYITKLSSFEFIMTDLDGQTVKVSRPWVVDHVDRESWRKAERGDCGTRVGIPEGDAPASQLPEIKYTNKSNQCVVLSFTSALHYLGHTKEAWSIVDTLNKCRERQHYKFEFDRLRPLIMDIYGKKTRIKRLKYEPSDRSHRSPNPIVASLYAETVEKGKNRRKPINHCVCFVGDYIFDSNRGAALPNNALSLDLICNGFGAGFSYGGIFWSRELVLSK
jgi:hypothetical protein